MKPHEHKWLQAKMSEVSRCRYFSILGEDIGGDYKSLHRLLREACDFLGNYYDDIPFFQVKCFADRGSFSKTAGREIDPGWMGAPVMGENNIIVLSLQTFDETGDILRFHSHLLHEISHICINYYLWKNYDDSFNFPSWLEEGICMWLESVFRREKYNDDTFSAKIKASFLDMSEKGIYLPISRMTEDLCLLDDPAKYSYGPLANYAYNKAFLAVEYLIAQNGEEIIFKMLPSLSCQKKLSGWLNLIVGKNLDENIDKYIKNPPPTFR